MMKKITLLVLCTLAIGSVSFAQGSYVRFNVGYGIPLGSQYVGEERTVGYSPSYHYDSKQVYGSFGSGVTINAAYGLALKGILGLDFEVGYLIGKENGSEWNYIDYPTYREEETRSVNGFSFTPSITFTAQEGKILPYTRFGPVLGTYKMKYAYSEKDIDYDYAYEEEYTGGITLGFKGSVGAIFNPTGKFQYFSEITFVSMNLAPKEGEITKDMQNGVSDLDDYSAEEKNFDFVDDYSYPSNGSYDRAKEKYAMGSISLQIGVRMKLN